MEPLDELSGKTVQNRKAKAWYEPDSSYAWVQVFAAGLIFLIIPGINRSFGLIYEQLLLKYQRSDTVTSWVPSVHGISEMCSSKSFFYYYCLIHKAYTLYSSVLF